MLSSLSCLKSSNITLEPHSERVVKHMLKKSTRGLIVAHGTGSGKTMTAIATAQCLLETGQVQKVLVITPTSLVTNFQKELKKFGVKDHKCFSIKTYGKMLSKYKHLLEETTEDQSVSACKDVFLICDEAHNLRTTIGGTKGKLANLILTCASAAKKVMLLTATPVVNNPYDICNLIAMVKGSNRPISQSTFENEILIDVQQFEKFFRCNASFYERSGQDPNYPKKVEHDVFLRMDSAFYKDYHALELQQFRKLKISAIVNADTDVWAFLGGIRRASNAAQLEEGPKINWIMDQVSKPGKSIVYSSFLAAGKDLLIQRLVRANIKFTQVHGSLSKEKRQIAVDRYNKGEAKVLLISKAGAEGLDTTNTARIILLDPTWNDATAEQVIGRAIRYKSHESLPVADRVVHVYKLYLLKPKSGWFGAKDWTDTTPSADRIMCELVQRKTQTNKQFLTSVGVLSIEQERCL